MNDFSNLSRRDALRLASLALLGGVGQARAALDYDGPPITLRLSHFAPANHPMSKAVGHVWIDSVEKESGGKIKIQAFYGGVLHGAKDGFKAAVNDITDITPAYVNYAASSFHLTHVLDLPFAFPSAPVACKVAEELYPKYFKAEYEAMGVLMANMNANGSYNFFTKKPVKSLDDAKGLKMRSAGGESSEILKALGTIPVAVPAPEAYSAFQRGVVDGVAFYNTGAVAYRVSELAKSMTELKYNNPSNAWAFNRKTFEALPPSVQRFMYVKMRQLSMMYGIEFDHQDVLSRAKFVEADMAIQSLSPAEMERWKSAVEPLWQAFIDKNEAEGRPAKALVADLRQLSAKYASWSNDKLMAEVTEHPVTGIIDGL